MCVCVCGEGCSDGPQMKRGKKKREKKGEIAMSEGLRQRKRNTEGRRGVKICRDVYRVYTKRGIEECRGLCSTSDALNATKCVRQSGALKE